MGLMYDARILGGQRVDRVKEFKHPTSKEQVYDSPDERTTRKLVQKSNTYHTQVIDAEVNFAAFRRLPA